MAPNSNTVQPLSEKLRREAGRLRASVDHSEFWQEAGYGTAVKDHHEPELSQISRNIVTSEMMAEAIESDLENMSSFSSRRQDNLRLIREEHRRAVRERFTERYSKRVEEMVQGEEGLLRRWNRARNQDDFSVCEGEFRKTVDVQREHARRIAEARSLQEPYEAVFNQYEPHIELDEVERLFGRLENGIRRILDRLEFDGTAKRLSEYRELSDLSERPLDIHREIVFDLLQGDRDSILVLDGPYGMERGDALMAGMNTNSDQPWPKAVGTTVHEFGHVDYRTYLPDEFLYTPVGEPASDTIDEACARLWQVRAGQSMEFCRQLVELMEGNGVEADPEELHGALNRVDLSNHSRIAADELTYPLHVIARFRIERALINGDLAVEDLEQEWDRQMEELLPRYDPEIPVGEKFLQEPHWGKAKFGYFPTYVLGHLASVQIFEAAKRHVADLEQKLKAGNYDALSEWLDEALYSHGRRYPTQELIRRATGEELSAEPYLELVEQKYSRIYS